MFLPRPEPPPWIGIPTLMLDGHAYEGTKANVLATLLSEHYHNHLALSKQVGKEGWQPIRARAHSNTVRGKKQDR